MTKLKPTKSSQVLASKSVETALNIPDDIKMVDYITLFKAVIEKHKNAKIWENGTFVGIKILSNTKVGAVGQDFIEDLCGALKIPIAFPINKKNKRASQSPWDIKIGNVTFELKTATEDTQGKFQFNHIRYHRNYDAVMCLGVSPNELLFNVYSKADIATGKVGNLVSMEQGGNASYKLTKSRQELFHLDSFADKLKQFLTSFK